MTVTELHRHLPEPAERTTRWSPTRAGILNVWRYYDEVFEFLDGRLILLGENGSGKSKALELLLPFLFDANLRANRLSTFGTGERTMHWNLMGEGASGTTRVGYVWLEFRFPGEPERWFTCGARLQASSHTSTVHADYFTTGLRVGVPGGLSLVTDSGQPLTRSALEQRLDSGGALHANATDYRSAVRTTLFPDMSEQRYDALITALLQLRTPKLSQRLDPSLLSTLLSKALPPLGQQEVTDLAEGFERLDRQRERLRTLEEEVQAARTLANRQRTYAQRVLRAGAQELISATTEMDSLTKAARRSAEEHDTVAEQRASAEAVVESLAHDEESTEARISGITGSELYEQGKALDRLRQDTADAVRRAEGLRADASRLRHDAAQDSTRLDEARGIASVKAETVHTLADDALHAAGRAGLAGVHADIEAGLDDRPRHLLRAAVQGRHDQIADVREALDEHAGAVARRQHAESDLDAARTVLTDTTEHQVEAARQREQELDRLTSAVQAWAGSCRELRFPATDTLLASVGSEPSLLALVDTAAETVLHELTRAETTVEATRAAALADRDDLLADIERLENSHELPPPAPATRGTDRTTMPGAPLWRLVRFVDGVSPGEQAAVEAALQASGMLDAWVTPAGTIDGHDVFADPDALAGAPGRSLAEILAPEPDLAVSVDAVLRLLGGIAYGERAPSGHAAAIGADGGWRLGNLTGSWSKPEPAHIGAPARRRAREQLLHDLRAELRGIELTLTELDQRRAALAGRRAAVASERAARPPHSALDAAVRALTRAESDAAAANTVVRDRIDTLGERERAVAMALHALSGRAAEHGVPTDRAALGTLARAVDSFADQANSWLDEHSSLVAAQRAMAARAEAADRSAAIARGRVEEATMAEAAHRRLAGELAGVEDTVGKDYQQVQTELDDLRVRLTGLRDRRRETGRALTAYAERLGVLSARRSADASARDTAAARRDAAARRFRHLATIGFAADADIDTSFHTVLAASDGVRAALEAARSVAAAWPNVAHAPKNLGDALHSLSESVHVCRTALSARADLDLETDEDVQLFTAMVDGIRVGATELLRVLSDDAEQSRRDITERERELFDQTLTGDTRRHLAARIRQAGELVDDMNARLTQVRTASKVAVRLVWQIGADLPPGTKAARDLLLKDPLRLTDADTESLHRFFRDRIEAAKANDSATSWEQQLAEVFDYTSWHQFVVKIDRDDGAGLQPLTKKLHGALSGGEKAIALHLPLFAAVAAHYQAVPAAPRLILLDEVFVGVDTTNRGQVFALLSALDLDLMLTSDHEWCTYRELSGIAIHRLTTGGAGGDAVTTTRFTWNGQDIQDTPTPT
ncbi:TIGR02680 family protein [Pseudonocardia spinosispora]|uniref:TIGR02680 family protein n=1 Tax=Pseudonocardia spinosispora TaxID=103441 RepID=UPI00041D2723|nr:TIGR02680 family protein [Pseudonocardia spinosispora]